MTSNKNISIQEELIKKIDKSLAKVGQPVSNVFLFLVFVRKTFYITHLI